MSAPTTTDTEVVLAPPKVIAAPPKVKKIRPARKQVKPGEVEKKEAPQTGKEYNIWYNKWAGGDREDSYSNKTKSQTRCNIRKDTGLTRANTTGNKYCCLFFARGCCPYGWECEYLHQLPDASTALPDTSKDCFARDKFADYRDDMGGVGSFQRQNRTLYVGRIKETGTGPETEEVVIRHFKEWGEIEKIRVLQYRSVAFVTYVNELNAQFAKEAMACQSLDNDEILNVRWATEDPNPTSKVEERERLEQMGRAAIQAKMDPRIVDAMRAVRALEEGVEIQADEGLEISELDDERPQKKRRLEIEDGAEVEGGPEEAEAQFEPEPEPEKPKGLLSADTLESLKYFTEIRKRSPQTSGLPKPAYSAKPPATGLGLGGYGSDEED